MSVRPVIVALPVAVALGHDAWAVDCSTEAASETFGIATLRLLTLDVLKLVFAPPDVEEFDDATLRMPAAPADAPVKDVPPPVSGIFPVSEIAVEATGRPGTVTVARAAVARP